MIRTEQIDAGRVKGLVTHADSPRAGVLLLCTISGVDAFMRERGQRLAEAGYSSLVWDPYPGEPLPQDLPSAQARARKLNDGAVDEMSDCVGYMLDAMKLPAVAVVGFCLGGRYALLLGARDKRLFACVPFYPSVIVPEPAAPDARCGGLVGRDPVSGASDPCRRRPGVQARGVRSGPGRAGTPDRRDHRGNPPGRGAQLHAAGPARRAGQCLGHPAVLAAGRGVPGRLSGAAGRPKVPPKANRRLDF